MRHLIAFALCMAAVSASYADPPPRSESCRIEDVEFRSQEKRDTIHLALDCVYSFPISYHFDYGTTEIVLPNTTFDEIPAVTINNRFLLSADLRREGRKTVLRIRFADADIHSAGLYDHEIGKRGITFSVFKKRSKTAALPNDRGEGVSSGESVPSKSPLNKQFLQESDTVGSIAYMLVALALVLGSIYLLLWLYNKLFLARFHRKKGGHTIKMVSSHHIAPRQRIAVLSIDDVRYACGISPGSINVIARITGGSFEDYLDSAEIPSDNGVDFARLRQEYADYRSAKKRATGGPTAQKVRKSFSAEFVRRIKNLRSID